MGSGSALGQGWNADTPASEQGVKWESQTTGHTEDNLAGVENEVRSPGQCSRHHLAHQAQSCQEERRKSSAEEVGLHGAWAPDAENVVGNSNNTGSGSVGARRALISKQSLNY